MLMGNGLTLFMFHALSPSLIVKRAWEMKRQNHFVDVMNALHSSLADSHFGPLRLEVFASFRTTLSLLTPRNFLSFFC